MSMQDILNTESQRRNRWLEYVNQWNPTQGIIGQGSDAVMLDMMQQTNAESYLNPYWYNYYRQNAAVPSAIAGLAQSRGQEPYPNITPERTGSYYKAFVSPPTPSRSADPQSVHPVIQGLLNEMGSGQYHKLNPTGVDSEQTALFNQWIDDPDKRLQTLLSYGVGGSPFSNYIRQQMARRLHDYDTLPRNTWIEYLLDEPGLGYNYRVAPGQGWYT